MLGARLSSWLPRRLLLGLLLAVALLAGLQWWVQQRQAGSNMILAQTQLLDLPAPLPDQAAGGRSVLLSLRGKALRLRQGHRAADLPQDTAPILQIQPGGAIKMLIPPPLAMTPGPELWPRAGLLLPRRRQADLSASERSSLLLAWSALSAGGGLQARQIESVGFDCPDQEIQTLLQWLR